MPNTVLEGGIVSIQQTQIPALLDLIVHCVGGEADSKQRT